MNIEDIIDRRREAGEVWVALAGIPFRVGERFYGIKKTIVLRTVAGKAFRLVEEQGYENTPKGLAYLHDVTIEDSTYHVFVAPADSALAKTLQTEPIEAGHGAPVLLRKPGDDDGAALAVRRVKALDVEPLDIPETMETMPPALEAEIEAIAKKRGWPLEVAKIYLLDQAVKRYRTVEKFESNRPKARRKK